MPTYANDTKNASRYYLSQRPKRAAREKRPSRSWEAVTGTPSAPVSPVAAAQVANFKPLAPLKSTKPSDTPMAQEKLKAAIKPIMPLPILPKVAPKTPTGKSKQTLAVRPKIGTK